MLADTIATTLVLAVQEVDHLERIEFPIRKTRRHIVHVYIPRWSSWRSCKVDILAAAFGAPIRRCGKCRQPEALPLQRLVAQSSIWRQSPLFRRRKFFPRPEISELLSEAWKHSVLKSPKMSHLNFELWHFRSIFVILKVVCLVTLLDW